LFALLGGGVKEPGWQNTRLSNSRLAIVSGYSHCSLSAVSRARATSARIDLRRAAARS
jgi:hypothetical protein